MNDMEIKELQQADAPELKEGVHGYSSETNWVRPENPITLERLEWFKDQKLALMMHWGPYSQIEVESWILSDEDGDWARKDVEWTSDYEELKREYFGLNRTFNPIRFQPELWAEIAAEGGFKYLIFTTKHHDGYCMWDTHTTNYRITGSETPFHAHRYADVCKHVFDAFRSKGLAIAAYFSKADWQSPYYWAPGMERGSNTWRGPSYSPGEYPWLWEQFVDFTHEQIMELMSRYGRIDILWLDAGWVKDSDQVKQDIRLGEVVERARQTQPWLLSADRTVGGPYENYVTPEQTIPERPLNVPWESCITIGTQWAFKYDDQYKSGRALVRILMEVVSKGGNLALNVGPQPDGRLPAGAVKSINELGEWMKLYGEAVYGTRVCGPYFAGSCAFTSKGNTVYCTYLYESANEAVAKVVHIPYKEPISGIELVGSDALLQVERTPEGISITLPDCELNGHAPIAHVFRMQKGEEAK